MTELQARAETLIVAISGVPDWRPLFVLGLGSLIVIVIAVILTMLIVWGVRK